MTLATAGAAAAPVLEVDGLTVRAGTGRGATTLVGDLSFTIATGEVLGIVGESGSGKSMTAAAIGGLLPAEVHIGAGRIVLEGREIQALSAAQRRALDGSRIGMVFQDPLSSFNPVRTVGSILVESAARHQGLTSGEARRRAIQALAGVRLPRPEQLIDAYPHQLSGGQRQRAMIALALLNGPPLVIADEPTTALDATVQLQVLALLKRGAGSRAVLLITHDLAVAAATCDRILVMQRGRSVEHGPAARVLDLPAHGYTRALLDAARRPAAAVEPARGAP
ncbi:MAG TPA: ABC transporter ATP-binding protein [Steroidobacteraceae bacterium]|nr:ABC transporter ATP-binding protein [Steroidobacteraceae bacterium]